jgi:hypothetical protein
MTDEQIRSLAHGPVGAYVSAIAASLVFGWLVKKWSRWIPVKVGKKGRAKLLKEHEITIRTSKQLTAAGVCILLVCYQRGWLNDHDWRGLGLVLGLGGIVPIGCIVSANVARGVEAIKECMVAFAISERTPPSLLIGVTALCGMAGVVSAISLLLRP